jgi:hypothetical protein
MKPAVKQQAAPAKSTQIQTAKPIAEVEKIPEWLQRNPGQPPMGLENLERTDMTLPRLAVAQALSPQLSESDPKYIEGLQKGMFFNTITREVYGKKVQVIPLLFYKSRILFNAMDTGGGMRCQSVDNITGIGDPGGTCVKCPLSQFGSARNGEGKGTACNQFFNYAAVAASDGKFLPEGLLVFSLKSSALKVAKDWNALIRIRNLDIFAGVYDVTSVERKNDVGRWYEPVITPAGNISRESYEMARELYRGVAEMNKASKLHFDVEDMEPGASDDSNA